MKINIVAIILIIFIIVSVFSGCFDNESTTLLTTNEIKDQFLHAVKTVTSYKYMGITNTIYTSTIDGTESTAMIGDLSIACTTDTINKKMDINITGDVEYMVESLANYSGEYTENYYYEGNDFYTPWIGNNTWHPWGGENQWYSYAILESQSDFIIQNSTLEKMDDETIDGDDCYVLNLNTPPEALFLESSSSNFVFSQGGYPNRYLEIVIKYWISKDNNLLKKAYFKTLVNSTGFMSHIPGDNQISLSELEVSFYDYNEPVIVQPPWQPFLDEVDKNLSQLDYVNTYSGYGLNPPEGFFLDEWSNEEILTNFEDLDEHNASLEILPPLMGMGSSDTVQSSLFENNLSYHVSEKLDYYTYNASENNGTLISHSATLINGMNAHKFVTTLHPSYYKTPRKYKSVYVEKGDRVFLLRYEVDIEHFNNYESAFNESINSFMMISPYFYIY